MCNGHCWQPAATEFTLWCCSKTKKEHFAWTRASFFWSKSVPWAGVVCPAAFLQLLAGLRSVLQFFGRRERDEIIITWCGCCSLPGTRTGLAEALQWIKAGNNSCQTAGWHKEELLLVGEFGNKYVFCQLCWATQLISCQPQCSQFNRSMEVGHAKSFSCGLYGGVMIICWYLLTVPLCKGYEEQPVVCPGRCPSPCHQQVQAGPGGTHCWDAAAGAPQGSGYTFRWDGGSVALCDAYSFTICLWYWCVQEDDQSPSVWGDWGWWHLWILPYLGCQKWPGFMLIPGSAWMYTG